MGQVTLVEPQIDAGARFLREFNKYAPVQVAFWLKDEEASQPWLYVASDQITDDNFDVGYEEVGRIADELRDPWFDLMRVKLIGADDPLAQDALALLRRYPVRTPTRFPGQRIGDIFAEEIYLYPTPVATAQ